MIMEQLHNKEGNIVAAAAQIGNLFDQTSTTKLKSGKKMVSKNFYSRNHGRVSI